MAEKQLAVSLEEELQTSYIDYAMSVIIGRAIPDAKDGLKPVQRRILYAMYNINNLHNQPTKKSARIVGEVIGKFHPHGDISIYDALARMAQDFAMNHMLVEGQGNFGSIDGDPPAAMRYTEVRLTKLAEEMLNDLEKETVDFVPNFDNTEQEPAILPAKVPNLLVNGASGIAVGVATSMPPHNLSEVCDAVSHVLENKHATVEELMGIIKGPDFPTGGVAIISESTNNGYKFGRGQVTIRAKIDIDEVKHRLIVKEIPYNVNKSQMIQTIVQLVRDKKIVGIKDVRDESGKEGISILIDLKEGISEEQMVNLLYKHTQLEVTFPIINLAIVGKQLKSLNVLQLITTFLDYRREVVTKRSRYELKIAGERLHIVEGLLIAITDIDNVVKTIKESSEVSDARQRLMKSYSLSDKQANAILDMKLSRLTKLENTSLTHEKGELQKTIAYHTELINDPAKVDSVIKVEMQDVKKKYGRPRRTEIVHMEGMAEVTSEDLISNDKVTVIMTNSGYVKRLGMTSYKEQARGGKGIISINLKEGDYVKQMLTCMNKDYLICISNVGRAYWLKAYNIPEGGRYSEGRSIANLLQLNNEKVVMMLNIRDFTNSKLAFLTTKGTVKKVDAELFSRPRANGIRAITLATGDEITDAIVYGPEKYLFVVTRNGKAIKFAESDLRLIGRAAMGVRGIRTRDGDVAENIIAASTAGSILTITTKGYGKVTDVNEYREQGRGGQGVINIKLSEKTGHVTRALFIEKEQRVILINSKGVSISFPIADIRVTGRAASGVRLMRLEEGVHVIDAQLVLDDVAVPAQPT